MELRQLKYFLSALRHTSIKEAAREHFVTQPAVSIQLRKLEEELGEKLYVRSGRRIRATQAGLYLLPHAEEVLGRVESLKEAARGLKGLHTGHLKLGNIDAASIYVLPPTFRAFRRKHPGVDIEVVVADSDRLLALLESGAIEIAIVTLPLDGEGLVVIPIFEDPMVLVASPRHELARRRSPKRNPLQAAAESGIITYPAGSTTRRLIEKTFIENGLNFRAAMETSSPEAIKRLTEAGLGASVLPLKVVSHEVRRGTLKIVPTGKIRFSRTLGVVYKDRLVLSQPARVFLDMLLGGRGRRAGRAG